MAYFFNILKILTVVVLSGLFLWNSWVIFINFKDGKMVTSSEDSRNKRLKLPALFICREVAFTDDMKDMSNLQEYFDNTLDLKYDLWAKNKNGESVIVAKQGAQNDTFLDLNSEDFKIEYVYSYSRGLCYTLRFLTEVLPYDYVSVGIFPSNEKNNEDLLVYVTEPGEEYYMHMFLWRVVPFSFKLGAEIESVDLTLKKVQKTNDHDCVKNYDYMDCLKSDYKQHSIPGTVQKVGKNKMTYPNCTMPWQQSMLNKHWTPSHNLLEFVACNDTELSTLFSLDYDYLKLAARLKNPNCAVPCATISYEGEILQMKQGPNGVWFKTSKTNSTAFPRYITMYYTTADIATFTSDKLVDFSAFISGIGGNLGLFLGLSFLGMLFWLYEWMENAYMKLNQKNGTKTIQVAPQ